MVRQLPMSDLSRDLASLRIDRDAPPSRGWTKKIIIALVVLAGAAGLIYFVAIPYLRAQVFQTKVDVTEITLVSPAQASIELTSTGYVQAQRISKVTPKVTGKVTRVEVQQGQTVKEGDVLYVLDTSDQAAAIAQAKAQVAAARARAQASRASLTEIKLQAERARRLAAHGVRPEAAADDLEARQSSLAQQARAADADVRAAQAQVKALEINLDGYTVLAPIAGRILNKPPEIGEVIAPVPGAAAAELTGAVEIADFSTLVVETDVPEGRLHMVRPGGPCEIVLDAFPSKRFRGKVQEIIPVVNRAKATVTVKVAFVDEPTGVLPDMSARASFLTEALDAAAVKEAPKLVVPESAVTDRGGGKVVFVVNDGKLRMTSVALGEKYAGGWVLTQGPPAGTHVVKNPSGSLSDGQRVEERTDG